MRCLLRLCEKEEVLVFDMFRLDLDCSRLSSIRHGEVEWMLLMDGSSVKSPKKGFIFLLPYF